MSSETTLVVPPRTFTCHCVDCLAKQPEADKEETEDEEETEASIAGNIERALMASTVPLVQSNCRPVPPWIFDCDGDFERIGPLNSNYLYVVSTPLGADYVTCPVCRLIVDWEFYEQNTSDDIDDNNPNPKEEGYGDGRDIQNCRCYYCPFCNIPFRSTHVYESNGCTDDLLFGAIMSAYRYKDQNYEGSVRFRSVHVYLDLIKRGDFEITEWQCLCDGRASNPLASYPESEYAEYYSSCPGHFSGRV